MINRSFIKKKTKEPSYPEGTLIIRRTDLNINGRRKSTYNIEILDISGSMRDIERTPIVLFLDSDGTTKTLKNRYNNGNGFINHNRTIHQD